MKNDWNKHIYPESFCGFMDASSHQNSDKGAFGEQRGATLVNLSQQAGFDGKLLGINLLDSLAHHAHIWGKISYEQLKRHFARGDAIGHHQVYVVINLLEMSDSAAINRCADLLEYFIGMGNVKIRLLLKNAFEITQCQLIKIVRMCELSGIERLCFNDDLALFSPSGVKRFLAALTATNYNQSLKFECAFSGIGQHAKDNAIMAITSGIHYLHVAASYLAQAVQAVSITQIMQEFSFHNFCLNKQVLQHYIFVYHNFGVKHAALPDGLAVFSDESPVATVSHKGNANNRPVTELEAEDDIALHFDVSANDWHVSIQLLVNGVAEDLGERVHHYVMLLLAREYYQQYQQMLARDGYVDPLLVGWVQREALHQMIGDNEAQFNVKLCRARKHISTVIKQQGVSGYQPLSTRQGAIRLNCGNVTVVQGSKVEFEMKNWHFTDELPQLKQA
ncbi:hypothetical protein [Thalassomonas haliotis]|uniref:EAL domain-containing protein n=1 Tax=Thalassomonas haliotis TaxID=485448 RepID=A0ABY7VDY3_9GAMM|nr:hypothetical protein [Thalassomonas haliotis]WDE11556.1 hypothetical protein H3N35_25690 [Thalassomonas haliotis]